MSSAELARFPLTAQLPEDVRDQLAARVTRRPVRRGQVIFGEGEPGEVVFLLLAGKVKVTRTPPDGREALLAVMGPGDVFGELAVFDPGPRTATATTLEPSEVAEISAADLKDVLAARPEASVPLLQALAHRLRQSDDALAQLVFTDVAGRVARALLGLADRFGRPDASGAVFVDHGLTQEELAQLVGAARETVNKALSDFSTRGWVRLEGRTVTLLDPDRLRQRAR